MLFKSIRVSTRDHRLEYTRTTRYGFSILTQKSFGLIFVVWRTHTGQPFAHLHCCPLFCGLIDCIHCELKNLDEKKISKLSLQNRSEPFHDGCRNKKLHNAGASCTKTNYDKSCQVLYQHVSTDWSSWLEENSRPVSLVSDSRTRRMTS